MVRVESSTSHYVKQRIAGRKVNEQAVSNTTARGCAVDRPTLPCTVTLTSNSGAHQLPCHVLFTLSHVPIPLYYVTQGYMTLETGMPHVNGLYIGK